MSVLTTIAAIVCLILLGILLGLLLRFIIGDARRRGYSDMQAGLICLACILFFPEGLILYLIFRPAPKTSCKQDSSA